MFEKAGVAVTLSKSDIGVDKLLQLRAKYNGMRRWRCAVRSYAARSTSSPAFRWRRLAEGHEGVGETEVVPVDDRQHQPGDAPHQSDGERVLQHSTRTTNAPSHALASFPPEYLSCRSAVLIYR